MVAFGALPFVLGVAANVYYIITAPEISPEQTKEDKE